MKINQILFPQMKGKLKEDEEIIENIDDFGTKEDLNLEFINSFNTEKNKPVVNNINAKETSKTQRKTNSKISKSLINNGISKLIKNSKGSIHLSKTKINSSIKDKLRKIKSPIKNIILNDSNNNIKLNSLIKRKKSIFSKISENLYNSYKDNLSTSKNTLSIRNKTNEKDIYNKLTIDKYLQTLVNKENIINNSVLKKYNKIKLNLINYKLKRKKNNKTISDNNLEQFLSSNRTGRKKMKSATYFLDNQQKYMEKHKIHIENIIKEQNKKINESMQNRPMISNDSKRIANQIKNKNEENIYLKLFNDFSLREKNREEMRRETFQNNNNHLGFFSNKKLSKKIIKQNSERLYKEYIKKDIFIEENANKQVNQLKIMALTKYMNKSSTIILFSKFINKYKNILNIKFNKFIEVNFEISFEEYLIIIIELGIIDNYYKLLFKKEKEKENANSLNYKKIHEKQTSITLWKDKNILTNINNIQNYKINENYIQYKNKIEYKLIKDSWKIITKSKEFNMEKLGNSERLLFFLLSVLGISNGKWNNYYIRNEFSFLIINNTDSNDINNYTDENLSKQIYKHFFIFRKSIFENLFHNNKNNYTMKKNKLNNEKKNINKNKNKSGYLKTKTPIYKLNNKNSLKNKINNNYNYNFYSNTDIFSKEDNSIYNNNKTFMNSKKNENTSFQKVPLKKLKCIFNIKIENEIKKLVINNNDNRIQKIEEFCTINKLDNFEKEQIINVVSKKFDGF